MVIRNSGLAAMKTPEPRPPEFRDHGHQISLAIVNQGHQPPFLTELFVCRGESRIGLPGAIYSVGICSAGSAQRHHSLAAQGLGEALGFAFCDDDVGMVQEPVDGR
jgi:hypothetical protein